MASCPHCKADLPEVGRFCAACGAPLGDDPAATREIKIDAAATTNKTILPTPKESAASTVRVNPPRESGRSAGVALLCAAVAIASSLITVVVYRHIEHPESSLPAATRMTLPGVELEPAPALDDLPGEDGATLRRVRGLRVARERAGGTATATPVPARVTPPPAPATPSLVANEARPAADRVAAPSLYDGVSRVGEPAHAAAVTPPAPVSPVIPSTPGTPSGAPAATGTAAVAATPAIATPAAAGTPGVYLGDVNAEAAPPSEADLSERRQQEIYADGIRFVMKTHQNQVGACYERLMKEEDAPKGGRVEMEFTVDREGKARKVQVASNTTGKEALGKCLQQRIADWKFARPPSGDYHASYPFIFAQGTGR